MFTDIDPRSPVPLYEQIAASVRVAVASGELAPESPLPSVRRLAARLRINPTTVVQAYRDLELDGFVERRQGSGTYVAEVPAPRRRIERSKKATQLAREVLTKARALGLAPADIREAITREIGEDHE